MMEDERRAMKSYGFGRTNLFILIFSIILIIVGYILLSGGESADGVSFDPEVFNSMRTGVAPVVLTLGYLGILVAVIWKDKSSNDRK